MDQSIKILIVKKSKIIFHVSVEESSEGMNEGQKLQEESKDEKKLGKNRWRKIKKN